jgi:hypothetical protein
MTGDLYIVHKEEFSITCYMCDTHTWQWQSLFIRDKRILLSDYSRKGLVAKKNLVVSLKGLGGKMN